MATTQAQTKVIETVKTKGMTAKVLVDKHLGGRALGSPINSMETGQERSITLTGNIEIREFQGVKGAYFTSKEGISVKVNASFDPSIHKEGAVLTIVCRELVTDNRTVKFASFKDVA